MENFRDGALLYNSARIHDDDVIRHFGNYPEIVRNQQNGTVDPALQIVEQIENLRLNRQDVYKRQVLNIEHREKEKL